MMKSQCWTGYTELQLTHKVGHDMFKVFLLGSRQEMPKAGGSGCGCS